MKSLLALFVMRVASEVPVLVNRMEMRAVKGGSPVRPTQDTPYEAVLDDSGSL